MDMVNESFSSLYDLLVSAYQNYYVSNTTLSLVPGTSSYSLPADFYKLISLDMLSGSNFITMFPYNELERNSTTSTAASIPTATVRMRYVPAPTVYTTIDQTIDGVAGWEDFAIWDTVAMMLAKEESDPSFAIGQREMMRAEIQGLAPDRDAGQPERVQDTTTGRFGPWWAT